MSLVHRWQPSELCAVDAASDARGKPIEER